MSDTSLLYTIFAIDKASMVNDRVGSSVNKLAIGVGIAGAAIAVKTTQMAANFQTSMLRVQTGAGELKSNMSLVSNGVLDLATKTGDTSKELATALYTVESGGQHGANGLLVLKAAAQGAKAEGADLNTVADATTSVLQDYHLKATDAALVTSQLVAATGQGKTTFEQLSGSLSAVLPIASAAHIKLSDVVGAIASMTVHGMSAEQASQNLADTIRHLQAPTLAQAKYMGQLGISSSDVTDKLGTRGVTGTLQYLSQTILSKMGPSGKVLLGTFNQSAQAAANVKTMVASMPKPLQDLANQFIQGKINSQDWNSALKGMTPTVANQMRQFATLEKRSTGFSDAIKSGTPAATSYTAALRGVTGDASALNTALMLTGENTAYTNTAVSAISKTTAEAGGNVKGWSEIQSTFNVRMGQAKEQVEVLGIRVGTALLPYMTKLVTAVSATVGWFGKHATVAKTLGGIIGILAAGMLLYKGYLLVTATATKIWSAAQWLLNLALDANPIGLIVIGIAALVAIVVLIATKTTWFQTAWKASWSAIQAAVAFVWTWIKAHWPLLLEILTGPIGIAVVQIIRHWGTIESAMLKVYHYIADPIADAVHFAKTKLDDAIANVKALPGKFAAAGRGMWSWIKTEFDNSVNTVIRGWNGLHFSFPSFDVLGVHTPGFTLNTPNIPLLAAGGTSYRGGLAVVGDRGPETMYLPAGAGIIPDGGRSGRNAGGGGGAQEIHIVVHTDIPATVTQIASHVRGAFSGNVQVALGGAT